MVGDQLPVETNRVHYSFHQNQYKSHYNQWHHYKCRDGVYCLCLFSSGSWGYLSKRAWFLYLNQCELVWTSQIHSVYIWMTHSHMRLCCSTIHNSNVRVITCSVWQLLLKFQCDFTDNRPGAHDAPPRPGGMSVRGCVQCVERGRGGGSIRTRLREQRFRNSKQNFNSVSRLGILNRTLNQSRSSVLLYLYLFHW